MEKKFKDNYLNTSRFLYVGIGASAGGLDALKKFLSNIPENSGMAFIIVQHMDPTHKSGLVNILDKYTDLKVLEIVDGVQVESENVYIIPPNKDLGILDGKLQLMEPIEPHGLRMPINYFFTSLAQDQGDKKCRYNSFRFWDRWFIRFKVHQSKWWYMYCSRSFNGWIGRYAY